MKNTDPAVFKQRIGTSLGWSLHFGQNSGYCSYITVLVKKGFVGFRIKRMRIEHVPKDVPKQEIH